MGYNSTIDKATDDILIYGNTAKDGSGTSYVPLLDTDGHQQVDVLSNALPTGASTLAEQQSQTTHLATIAGDTTAIETSVQLLDDTVATDGAATPTKGILMAGQDGTNAQTLKTDASGELQVDVLTMPTTTVTATDLDIRNLVNTDVVTAELSATDNAVLDAIAASVAAIDTDATTIIGHVDGIESTLTTISGNVDGLETSNSAIQTAVQLIDDTVQVLGTDTYTEATSKGITLGAVRRDADTPLANTTNEYSPLITDANGYLKTEVFSGQTLPVSNASASVASGAYASGSIASGAIASGAIAAGAIAAGATSIADNEDVARAAADRLVKVAQVRVDAPPSGANVSGTEDYTQFIADSYGKTWIAGSVTEDVAHAAGESIMGSGVRRIDTPASSAGSSGDWATMDASAEGALWTTNAATTTGGVTVANFNTGDTFTALTSTAQVIKATAGNFYGYYIYNPNSAATYVMLYNTAAASVTVGTTTPFMVFCIPATAGANLSLATPITFTNAGWSIAATTTGGGNTAPATALEAMIWYK